MGEGGVEGADARGGEDAGGGGGKDVLGGEDVGYKDVCVGGGGEDIPKAINNYGSDQAELALLTQNNHRKIVPIMAVMSEVYDAPFL